MTKTFIAVRDVDEETFRKFRAMTVGDRLKLGDALTMAMKNWIKESRMVKNEPDPKNLLKISGVIKAEKNVKWSKEVDEILYGLKK